VSARYRQLATHVRTLPDDDLNDLLVQLPTHRFAWGSPDFSEGRLSGAGG
jgi:hypothetical protein